MVSTLTTGRQETAERWLQELSEAKKELNEAMKDIVLLDDPTSDPKWRRYYRLFMNLD